MYHINFVLLLLFLGNFVSSFGQESITISSPDGNISMVVGTESGQPWYTVSYKGEEWISQSNLGFELRDQDISFSNVKIIDSKIYSENSVWQPVYGEHNQYNNHFQGLDLTFSAKNSHQQGFILKVKLYNEGVAFCYKVNTDKETVILSENTSFHILESAKTWITTSAQGVIEKINISEMGKNSVERPLLIELSDSAYLAIGEAGLYDFARMKLIKTDADDHIHADLEGEVRMEGSFHSPWRFIMMGTSPNQLLQNNSLVLNLSPPNAIGNTDWIRPGKVIREVTLTTQGGMACIDFAAKYGIQYVEFDAGWYGNEYDDAADATTVSVDPKRSKGPLDLHKVIAYANSKNIGIILYINRRALEVQLDKVLPLYQSWGIKGVKYGFVRVGTQNWTKWLHDAVYLAAKYNLMVDIHDEYRPTGMSRTYPNLLTQEGIRGDEESPNNSMVLNTLYTRMLAGAGDHTNCYFADRVSKMGSHASQMAKSICIYSPWQFLFWYDRPEASPRKIGGAGQNEMYIHETPELSFFKSLPTVWDETRILEGYPGQYTVIARKNGNDWFLGGFVGEISREMIISLEFLEAGKYYEATIYTDKVKLNSPEKVNIKKKIVNTEDRIRINLAKNNGIAVVFKQI